MEERPDEFGVKSFIKHLRLGDASDKHRWKRMREEDSPLYRTYRAGLGRGDKSNSLCFLQSFIQSHVQPNESSSSSVEKSPGEVVCVVNANRKEMSRRLDEKIDEVTGISDEVGYKGPYTVYGFNLLGGGGIRFFKWHLDEQDRLVRVISDPAVYFDERGAADKIIAPTIRGMLARVKPLFGRQLLDLGLVDDEDDYPDYPLPYDTRAAESV